MDSIDTFKAEALTSMRATHRVAPSSGRSPSRTRYLDRVSRSDAGSASGALGLGDAD